LRHRGSGGAILMGVTEPSPTRNPMFQYDETLANLVFDYCRRRLSLEPVPLDFGGQAPGLSKDLLAGLIGAKPNDPEKILSVFSEHLATAIVSADSPRFLSFIPAVPTKASLLFDMIVSCSCLQGTSWLEAAGAVLAENQALRVLADLAGLPASAGGCFVSGGSMGNLSALVVARDTAPSRLDGVKPSRPRVVVSDETHSSVAKALNIIGVEPLIVPHRDHRLTGAAIDHALSEPGAAESVVAVVATAGTTNAGLVDDLVTISEVTRRRDIWLHVDGAYGGAALFAPSVRDRFAGIEQADSLVIDPHKWLYAPFDCAAILYRDPALARPVHSQQAEYLDVFHDTEEFNPSDYAYHLTRRARGLPLWFSLAVYGTDAYRDAVEQVLTTARLSAALIEETEHVELVRQPELSVVLFSRPGWERADYDAWSVQLLNDQIGFVTPTSWEGRPVGRFAFLHPDTSLEMVGEILATLA